MSLSMSFEIPKSSGYKLTSAKWIQKWNLLDEKFDLVYNVLSFRAHEPVGTSKLWHKLNKMVKSLGFQGNIYFYTDDVWLSCMHKKNEIARILC